MMKIDSGAIGFTSGFSREHKYSTVGEQITVEKLTELSIIMRLSRHDHVYMKGFQEDRCALYVWRLAVYYAEHETHEPEKLKWWYWKDRPYPDPDEGENIHEFAE